MLSIFLRVSQLFFLSVCGLGLLRDLLTKAGSMTGPFIHEMFPA